MKHCHARCAAVEGTLDCCVPRGERTDAGLVESSRVILRRGAGGALEPFVAFCLRDGPAVCGEAARPKLLYTTAL